MGDTTVPKTASPRSVGAKRARFKLTHYLRGVGVETCHVYDSLIYMEVKFIPVLTCQRCKYEWVPRTYPPKQCPGCKSRRWQELEK